jgi:RNA polymerase sigma-70 factor (ECF subfamily)
VTKTEAELVKELKCGAPEAFNEFAHRYGSRIYDLHCWLCGDAATAEDLAQETVVAVFKGIAKFRGGSSLYTWVYQIARRIAHRHMSRNVHDCVRLDEIGEFEASDDTEKLASAAILRDRVREALKALPAGQRESVVLHCLQGYSHSETAKALRRPLGTVKWQIAQGLHSLRESLQRAGDEADEM